MAAADKLSYDNRFGDDARKAVARSVTPPRQLSKAVRRSRT